MNKIYCILIVLSLGCFSCGDFLKEYSSDLTYASSCKDLEEVLLGECYMARPSTDYSANAFALQDVCKFYFPWVHVMDDDLEEYVNGKSYAGTDYIAAQMASFHCWQKNPFFIRGAAIEDQTWRSIYKHIGALNVILKKVNDFKGDDPELVKQVQGEAYFLRAYYYFSLVNLYGKPYNAKTAATDLGVPIKITEFIDDKYYSRSSVAAVYEQVLSDLNSSISYFSDKSPVSIRRASGAAARLLLSRVYLYMGDWENVIKECDKIKWEYSLKDLNTSDSKKSFLSLTSPELIFSQGPTVFSSLLREPDRNVFCFQATGELTGLYDTNNDLRKKHFFYTYNGAPNLLIGAKMKFVDGWSEMDMILSDVCLMRYAEVFLNKAEALAMLDRDREAVIVLSDLLKYRLIKVTPIQETGEKLVDLIRVERRKELCLEGHRWFDLRRYAVSPKYSYQKEIAHKHLNIGTLSGGTYVLKKYDKDKGGYVMPIPDYAIIFNNGVLESNERSDREKI